MKWYQVPIYFIELQEINLKLPLGRKKKTMGYFFNLKNGIKNIIERSCQQLRNFVLKNEKVRYSIFIGNTNKCFYFYNGTLWSLTKKFFVCLNIFAEFSEKFNFCGQLKNEYFQYYFFYIINVDYQEKVLYSHKKEKI